MSTRTQLGHRRTPTITPARRWSRLLLVVACGLVACKDAPPGAGDDPEQEEEEDDPPAADIVDPSAAVLKKLRTFEYRNTIAALLGDAIEVTVDFNPDLVRASFTSVSAAADCYSDIDVEAFEQAALEIAEQAFTASPTPLEAAGCQPSGAEDACVADFIASFGLAAWRRPLAEDEVTKYAALAGSLASTFEGDVVKGVELTVAAMLQSPHFLYRVELGTGLPDDPETRKYDSYEMATRLAYTLWETTPDAMLLEAAAAGELQSEPSVREYAAVMLDDPRANKPLQRFWKEHLGVNYLNLTDHPREGATEALYDAMRKEGAYLSAMVVQPGTDALEFLTADRAWLTPELAIHYGASPDAVGPEAGEVALPPTRRGYLTSGLFLTSNSHPGKTSPTRRGKFIVERILCRRVLPPPDDVDVSLPEVDPGEATRREQIEMHATNPTCAGCHLVLDPPGFAFEGFDALGVPQSTDNGLPIDDSSQFGGQDFAGAVEFIELLKDSPEVPACVARQAFRSTLGQVETDEQEPYVDAFGEAFTASGHDFRALVIDIVSSEAFRFARRDNLSAPEGSE